MVRTFILGALRWFVRTVDRINQVVGHGAMYLLLVMMAILSYSIFTNAVLKSPAVWVMEMAQFTMAAYYLLGGGFTMQEDAHVRMDVLHGRLGPRMKAALNAFTGLFLLFYLVVLFWGGVLSTEYAIEYSQKNYTSWAPPMAPIKIIMTIGVLLMLLQAISEWLKDTARAFGKELA